MLFIIWICTSSCCMFLRIVAGAGNHANLVLCDVLHKLLVEDEVVLLKLNPVNE